MHFFSCHPLKKKKKIKKEISEDGVNKVGLTG